MFVQWAGSLNVELARAWTMPALTANPPVAIQFC